jgi:shikimate kinase
MPENKTNIVLIGMPGSGKSTVGVILAKMTSKNFIDTDVLIQIMEGRSLQDIVDKEGHMALRQIEERVLLTINCKDHVIATGGSAAYSHAAISHLKKDGIVVFLQTDLQTLKARIRNFDIRGLAKRPDQSFEDLYEERLTLYQKYADITIESSGSTQEEVCATIIGHLENLCALPPL